MKAPIDIETMNVVEDPCRWSKESMVACRGDRMSGSAEERYWWIQLLIGLITYQRALAIRVKRGVPSFIVLLILGCLFTD